MKIKGDMPFFAGLIHDGATKAVQGALVGLALIGSLAFGFFLFAGESATPPPGEARRLEWIDVHVHLVGGRGQHQDYGGAVHAALGVMAEAGIRKMVMMPPPQVFGSPPPYDYESFVAYIKQHPARFAFLGGGGRLNAMLQEEGRSAMISDRVRRQFEEEAVEILRAGAAGVGEITAHHLSHTAGHPYESIATDHPFLLLLVDIAARNDAVIDLHLDLVAEDMKTPDWLASPPNPPVLRANLAAFERLLEHNRKARIIWAHAGSDMLGHWTTELSRRLFGKHPNLYMGLRMGPGRAPQNHPLTATMGIRPEWLRLLQDFSDRFVIGGDQFIAAPSVRGTGPGIIFSQRAPMIRKRTRAFLDVLPSEIARKVGYENAMRLYRLKD
ncbi:MAG: amidohydrolase family protein [Deltaproteobacteria bacterium]|nr:amidohydrolase family protein [Deltaproteobacteria bacterium]